MIAEGLKLHWRHVGYVEEAVLQEDQNSRKKCIQVQCMFRFGKMMLINGTKKSTLQLLHSYDLLQGIKFGLAVFLHDCRQN